jgi:16S rRNA processing protein RimM
LKPVVIESSAPAIDIDPPADLIEVGHVVEAYGVKGGLKVQPYSAQPDAMLASKVWWLTKGKTQGAQPQGAQPQGGKAQGGQVRRVAVTSAKRHGATVAAIWAGVEDRDQAQLWRGWAISIPRSQFPAPAEGEFYWVDMIGCELLGLDADGGKIVLGTVTEVVDNGAHEILRVERVVPVAPGQALQPLCDAKGQVQEVLVPFVEAYIRTVDIEARRIDSDWPADF